MRHIYEGNVVRSENKIQQKMIKGKKREEHIELSFHLNVSIIFIHKKMQTSEFNHLPIK